MSMRVVFFVNHQSQGVRRKGSRLKSYFEAHPNSAYSYFEAQSEQATEEIFTQLQLTPQDHLFMEGGDGTMQTTLTCLMKSLKTAEQCPKLSIIAGGLTNQIAANIGLKASRHSHITSAITQSDKGLRPTPILKLDGLTNSPIFGCLFSSGALPFVTEYYAQKVRDSHTGGKAAIAATLIKAVTGNQAARDQLMPATELSLRLTSGQNVKTKIGPHLGTVVTTLPSLMMGLDPFCGQNDHDNMGGLRVFYADAKARRLVRNLTGLWLGRKSVDRSGDGLESFQAERLDYHYDGPIVLDGEMLTFDGPCTVTATPPLPFVTSSK